jgi:hypothetical protein
VTVDDVKETPVEEGVGGLGCISVFVRAVRVERIDV